MFLRTVPIRIIAKNLSVEVCALLDDGPTLLLVDENLIKKLNLTKTRSNVSIKGIAGNNSLLFASHKVTLDLLSSDGHLTINNALIVQNLAQLLPIQLILRELVDLCRKNYGVFVTSLNVKPSILIGQDNCNLIRVLESRTIFSTDLAHSRCKLRWSIHGNTVNKNPLDSRVLLPHKTKNSTRIAHRKVILDAKIDKIVESYFRLDSIGITDYSDSNPEQSHAVKILEETSRYRGEGWETGLLWKPNVLQFPDGKANALYRLRLLEKRLDRDETYAEKYYKEMDHLFEQGFAEKVDSPPKVGRMWNVPHFGLQKRTNKVRLVFDAAARSGSVSLNNLLLTGPDFLKSLVGILMRFSQFLFAVIADIKDMFMRTKIRKEDQDAQRFLWRRKNRTGEPLESLIVWVKIFS